MENGASLTKEHCNHLKFDFTDPQTAFNLLHTCRGLEPTKNSSQLIQRFTSSWAQHAVNHGVSSALQALKNPNVRSVLLPSDDWNNLVTHLTGSNAIFSQMTSSINTLVVLQAVTIVSILISVFMISYLVWMQVDKTDPVKTAVSKLSEEERGLLNNNIHIEDYQMRPQHSQLDFRSPKNERSPDDYVTLSGCRR